MAGLRVGSLPGGALAAAAAFHARILPDVLALLSPLPFRGGAGGGVSPASAASSDKPHPNPSPEGEGLAHLTLVFPPADHSHRAWRLAAVQALAREHAPIRVNALASDSAKAIAAALAYLETAGGVTGQLLQLDDTGAGEVVNSAA